MKIRRDMSVYFRRVNLMAFFIFATAAKTRPKRIILSKNQKELEKVQSLG